MDPLTHTLVGAVTAQAFFKKKAPESVPILCWASNLPDIDTLALLSRDPVSITLRRSFGHSVFLYPLWCAALALLFKRLYPSRRYASLLGLCLLGASLHVFFDLVNSFGVLALWPFSTYRPELAIIFIVDPVLTGLLALPFLLAKLPAWKGRLHRAAGLSVALVCAYVLFCAGSRARAEMLLMRQAEGAKPDFSYVFPEPLGAHRWRGALRLGDEYRLYLINSLTGRLELRAVERTDQNRPAAASVAAASPAAKRLLDFFKAPLWSVTRAPDGGSLVSLSDLRFRPLLFSRPGLFEFTFHVRPDGLVEELGWAGR